MQRMAQLAQRYGCYAHRVLLPRGADVVHGRLPIPDVTLNTHYWYTLGLESIWVYAATVFMASWFGLAKIRLSQKSYTTTVIAVGILAFVVNGI